MRISFVVYGSLDKVTGGNVYDRQLVQHLRASGDHVQIISLPSLSLGARILENLTQRLPADTDLMLQDELIHLSMLSQAHRRRTYPIVGVVHNLHSSEARSAWQNAIWRTVEWAYLESLDGLVFNSRTTHLSVSEGLHVAKPCVVATPGGDRLGSVDPDFVAKRAHGSGPLRLLFLANITPLKGLHVLLNALSLLQPNQCTLDVVGSDAADAAYATRMRRRARDLKCSIDFHGMLDGDELAGVMKRTQVMVIPSFYEGYGIAYLEGMAFGLPAIGTTAGAIPELVKSGENGYLIEPGNSESLARILAELHGDRTLLDGAGRSALEFFRRQPTWQESMGSIRQFLSELASRHQSD